MAKIIVKGPTFQSQNVSIVHEMGCRYTSKKLLVTLRVDPNKLKSIKNGSTKEKPLPHNGEEASDSDVLVSLSDILRSPLEGTNLASKNDNTGEKTVQDNRGENNDSDVLVSLSDILRSPLEGLKTVAIDKPEKVANDTGLPNLQSTANNNTSSNDNNPAATITSSPIQKNDIQVDSNSKSNEKIDDDDLDSELSSIDDELMNFLTQHSVLQSNGKPLLPTNALNETNTESTPTSTSKDKPPPETKDSEPSKKRKLEDSKTEDDDFKPLPINVSPMIIKELKAIDEDDDFGSVDRIIFALNDPLGGGRINLPVKSAACVHFECFDYENFCLFNKISKSTKEAIKRMLIRNNRDKLTQHQNKMNQQPQQKKQPDITDQLLQQQARQWTKQDGYQAQPGQQAKPNPSQQQVVLPHIAPPQPPTTMQSQPQAQAQIPGQTQLQALEIYQQPQLQVNSPAEPLSLFSHFPVQFPQNQPDMMQNPQQQAPQFPVLLNQATQQHQQQHPQQLPHISQQFRQIAPNIQQQNQGPQLSPVRMQQFPGNQGPPEQVRQQMQFIRQQQFAQVAAMQHPQNQNPNMMPYGMANQPLQPPPPGLYGNANSTGSIKPNGYPGCPGATMQNDPKYLLYLQQLQRQQHARLMANQLQNSRSQNVHAGRGGQTLQIFNNPKPQYSTRFVNPHSNAPMYTCPICDTKFPMASLTISDGFNFFIKSAPKNIDRVEVLVESEKYRLIDDAMTRYIPKKKAHKSGSPEDEAEEDEDEVIVLLSSDDEDDDQEGNNTASNGTTNNALTGNNNDTSNQNSIQNATQTTAPTASQTTSQTVSQNSTQTTSQTRPQNTPHTRSQNSNRRTVKNNVNKSRKGSRNGSSINGLQDLEDNSVFEEAARMLNEKFQNNGTGSSWDDPVVLD